MKKGYARVSTEDQNLDRQVAALKKAGCKLIFKEKVSGGAIKRPELDRLLDSLEKGDVVVVQKLDRLGRSLQHLIHLISSFKALGVGFVSLGDSFDTTTSQGRLIFSIVGAIAEFEKDLISERTKDGLSVAKKNGVKLGRKVGLSKKSEGKAVYAMHLIERQGMSVTDVCKEAGISRPTFYKHRKLEMLNKDSKKKD